jgi:hypothetical protein
MKCPVCWAAVGEFLAVAGVLMALPAYAVGIELDRAAVETVVRNFEQAVQEYDFKRANSMLESGAQWIEDSKPGPADYWPQWWLDAKVAGVRIINRPYDFTTRVEGSVAWVTLTVEVTCLSNNAKGQQMCADNYHGKPTSDTRKLVENFAESEVLVKSGHEWRIALGHTSRIPSE